MNSERKMLYISASVSFVVGIVLGIILFYGQLRAETSVSENAYVYDKTATLTDFFRISWNNILWLFSIFVAHSIFPVSFFQPIVSVRGCVSAFSVLYILSFFGIKEAVASAVPQCLCMIPMIIMFSVENVIRCRENVRSGREMFSLKRYEAASIFVFSALAGGAEIVFFRFLCIYLF